MTTTAEVHEAGLRWRERCAADAGDAVAYLSSPEGPTEAQPWPASIESAGQPQQPSNPVSPCTEPARTGAGEGWPSKRQGLVPRAPVGPPAPPGLLEDGADLCGQYPARHAPRPAPCSLLQPPTWAGMLCAMHTTCAPGHPPQQPA